MPTSKSNIQVMVAEYRCPLCHQTLSLQSNSYRCVNSHSFDQAKQGYVNLLPVQFKHSKEPGDNKAMVPFSNQASMADDDHAVASIADFACQATLCVPKFR